MEDHCDAYPFWKELGVRGKVCVHVDAHLDVSTDGFTSSSLQKILACGTRADLEACRVSEYLPWGGFHCGNYLYPALVGGMVEHLVWVLPPHLPVGNPVEWARDELQHWLELTADEYRSLRAEDGRVEGRLAGRRLTLCTADRLPPDLGRGEPVLLDLDVDYFLDPRDRVWQTPEALRRQLGDLPVEALTVAWSVNGGYTPLEHRYLGEVSLALFGEADERWNPVVDALLEEDRRRETPGTRADYAGVLEGLEAPPTWLRAAVALKQGLADGEPPGGPRHLQAALLDEAWRLQPLNQGALHFRREEYDQAEAWLDRAAGESPDLEPLCRYMQGLADLKRHRLDGAAGRWLPLVSSPRLGPAERSHVAYMRGKVLRSLGRAAEASDSLALALEAWPDQPVFLHHLGLALRDAGRPEEAAAALRRSVRLEPDRLGAADARLALAEVYDTLGRAGLAQAERRRVAQTDPTGFRALKACLRGAP